VHQNGNSIRHLPRAKASRPAKRPSAPRKASKPGITFQLTGEARKVAALARTKALVEERGLAGAMRGYHARRTFDSRMTEIADRIAGKPRASRDDLLTLALAARYAAGARETLIKAILRAGGINPESPFLRIGPRR
jgi:hypothetical protein